MAYKIKYNGTNVAEYADSEGSIPGIVGSTSVTKNYFLHQLYEWQSWKSHRTILSNLEGMFSDFPGANGRIRASVRTRSGSSGSLTFPTSSSYIKFMNYIPPQAILRRTYTTGDGTLPTTRDYMRYLIVGGGGGGGKGTSPRLGTGIGGAGGGGGAMAFGEAKIGGFSYEVGTGGSGATNHGNRGTTGAASSIYTGSRGMGALGGQGGGNETLTGAGGRNINSHTSTLNNRLSGHRISGEAGGRNRSYGTNRNTLTLRLTIDQTIGLGDLIDGGSNGWISLLGSNKYLGNTALGGAGDDVNGGSGGGGGSFGEGGKYPRGSTAQSYPGIGGGGAGAGGKSGNGQKGGNGIIYIFW